MIGQTKIISQLERYTFESIPKTIMLIGERGAGKHSIANKIAANLNISTVTVEINAESIDLTDRLITYRQCPIPKLYLIDLSTCDSKKQNKFLKFIEEPSKNMLVVVLVETAATILPTILNRCYKIYLENYTKEELKQVRIYPDEHIYDVCNTPGQLLNVDYMTFSEMWKKAELIATVPPGRYANTVSIECFINYKDNYDKWDFELFLRTLETVAYKQYIENNCEQAFRVYQTVNSYKQKLIDKIVIKENFMIKLLSDLQKENKVE